MMLRKAILVIHGFGGGVYDEEYLTNRLELIKNYDVYTFTQPIEKDRIPCGMAVLFPLCNMQ